ncbi:MAG: family 16 glycosylhydrolase [Rickettsiales bacterium]
MSKTAYFMAIMAIALMGAASTASAQVKAFTDKFTTIDKSRWNFSHGWTNGDHQSCEWRENAAYIKDNKLLLTISDWGGKVRPYGCPELHTKDRLGHGRFEARMRTAAGSGLVTAFFSYIGPPNGVPEWDEIDFEILGKDPTKVDVNYVVNGKGIKGKVVDLGFDSSKDFHDYAFEWTKTGIAWFVDGKEIYRTPAGAPLPRNPAPMFFSLWSGSAQQDVWTGKFNYTQPLTAEVISAKFTPME